MKYKMDAVNYLSISISTSMNIIYSTKSIIYLAEYIPIYFSITLSLSLFKHYFNNNTTNFFS